MISAGSMMLVVFNLAAQHAGTVNFGNNNSSLITIGDSGIPVKAGDGIKAALYWAPEGSDSLVQLGASVEVGVPIDGIFAGGTRIATNAANGSYTAAGATGQFQVRAWSGGFATYEDARDSGVASLGQSSIIPVPTGGATIPPTPPGSLTANGLNGFAVSLAITRQPFDQTKISGATALFIVAASGTPPLNYRWYKNDLPLADGENVSGAGTTSLTLFNVSETDAASYKVIVTNATASVTSRAATLTVLYPPSIASQPESRTNNAGTEATFTVTAGGTAPLNYQWSRNGTPLIDGANISGATNNELIISSAGAPDAGTYQVVITNIAGSITSQPVTLTVIIPPAILTQTQGRTNSAGTIADFRVLCSGNFLIYQWRKNGVTLADGGNVSGATDNILTVSSLTTDDAGIYDVVITNAAGSVTSAPIVLAVVIPPEILVQPISQTTNAGAAVTFNVTASGNFLTYRWRKGGVDLDDGGIISGSQTAALTLANVLYSDGGDYTVVVTNSAGTVTSDVAILTVDVAFPKSVYNGLFYDSAGISHESSGFFTAKATTKGTFSAKLQLAGKTYSSSGEFDLDGKATKEIARPGLSPISVELNVDFSEKDQITGRLTDGTWSADLIADMALFDMTTNPAPQAGRYTIRISGNPDSAESPGGDGCGTVTVDAGGKISLKGILGDGTKISQKTSLSKNGQWPLYVSIYKRAGSILSWVNFTNDTPKIFGGNLNWIKHANSEAKLYSAGFTNETTVSGSAYTPPLAGNPVLDSSEGIVLLSGGNLSQPFSNNVMLGADNKLINLSSNNLSLKISPATGLFKGKVTTPENGQTIPFKGAVSQKENSGFGFFLGTNQSGHIYFGE